MSNTFSAFVEDFHSHMTRDPNDCVLLGVEKRLNDLPDPSLDQLDDEVAEAVALVDRAKGMDRSKLDFDQALDLDLAALQLESDIYQDRLAELAVMLMEQIGNPDWERLLMAAALAASIPEAVKNAAHSAD